MDSGYLALSLTGCAAVAVLGARRPGVIAWNGVVLALLAVYLLPLAGSLLLRSWGVHMDSVTLTFLVGALAVGVLNYLPTRFARAALALLVGSTLKLAALLVEESHLVFEAGWIPLVLTPWFAYAASQGPAPAASEFDRLWLDFRNRFGLVWAVRVRDQFNRSAANTGWPVVLRWPGLRVLPGPSPPGPAEHAAMVATLRALLKRFGPAEERRLAGRPQKPPTP
jgi:hypothetical protein